MDEYLVKICKEKDSNNFKNKVGILMSFGSYSLGVDLEDSDIDLVAIVPDIIDRYNDFFTGFFNFLQETP
jgi:poly(A) polymerase Pap1